MTKQKKPPSNILKNKFSFNPYAPFIKAYDRLALLETAKKLHDQDLIVTSYSKGQLKVIVRDTQLNTGLYDQFKSAGVVPYGLKFDMSGVEADSTPLSLMTKIFMAGDTDSIMQLDRHFYKPHDTENNEVENVGQFSS